MNGKLKQKETLEIISVACLLCLGWKVCVAELWWPVDVNLMLGCRAEAEADGSNLVFDQSNFGSAGGSWWRAPASSPALPVISYTFCLRTRDTQLGTHIFAFLHYIMDEIASPPCRHLIHLDFVLLCSLNSVGLLFIMDPILSIPGCFWVGPGCIHHVTQSTKIH